MEEKIKRKLDDVIIKAESAKDILDFIESEDLTTKRHARTDIMIELFELIDSVHEVETLIYEYIGEVR